MFWFSVFIAALDKEAVFVALTAFQGQYPCAITMQRIIQLQWADIKATSEKVIISFLENKKVQ